MRPLPANCNLVTEEEARGCLNEGQYNLLIAHNVRDAFWAEGSDLPKLMVFHNKLTTESGLGGNQVDLDKYREQFPLALPVISNQNTNDYLKELGGLAGIVIHALGEFL